MKYDVVTIGDAFEDVLVLPTDLKVKEDRTFTSGYSASFELGEKIPLKEVDYEIGGSACNASVGFSRIGLDASLATVVGNDSPSEKIFQKLVEEKVDTSNILIDKTMKTNFSVIFRFERGRSIFVYHGLKDYSKLRLKKNLKTKWMFVTPLGDKTDDIVSDVISQVSENGVRLAWNPGAVQIKKGASHFRNLLKNTTVLFLNREEAIKFTDYPVRPMIEDVIKKLFSFGPKIVVITSGKEGAKAFDGKNFYKISAIPNIIRVDSTGAGDSFSVGFLSRLMRDRENDSPITEEDISEALRWGIINSNSVITQIGAQKGLLTHKELERNLQRYGRLATLVKAL